MKILYIANAPEFDSPLGYCPNWRWIQEAFERFGHTVRVLDESSTSIGDVFKIKKRFDLLLLEEGRLKGDHKRNEETKNTEIHGYIGEVMKRLKIPSVVWLTNIFWGVEQREVQIETNPIFKADIVFSTDGGHDEEWKEKGVNHRTLRQGIHLPEAYIGQPIFPTTAEIGFVGAIYEEIWPYRKKLVDWLARTYGNRFVHVGARGEVRHEYLNNFCATVKIVVGDSVASRGYWSNRIYEITGRGGFLIHPMIKGLEKEFTPYKHFVPYTFGDFDGLKEKIDYYLTHDKEREEIRMAGFNHCREKHTYDIRVHSLLKTLVKEQIVSYDMAFPHGR